MADSTLDTEGFTAPPMRKGSGTNALGPSDTSDSGSDLQGPGVYECDTAMLNLDKALDQDRSRSGAGRDIGDANRDSDTDAGGTGERGSAGRDIDVELGSDIAPDRIIGSTDELPADLLEAIALEQVDEENEEDVEEDRGEG
ncbi:MAG: hypothetical protein H0V16_05340 [Burkholderiaceae bacterium]|nr:hypothetical protein [Burkholderiaceae bacterium]